MWSQHGFWNNLESVSGPGGGGGYYPGYPDPDLSSFYKPHYGFDPAAAPVFGQKHDLESPSRGKISLRKGSVNVSFPVIKGTPSNKKCVLKFDGFPQKLTFSIRDSGSVSMSTPLQDRNSEGLRDLTQLTPPDSDCESKDDKPFRCGYPKCQYETNRRNNLKRHMVTMHERLASPHTCCGIVFYRKADMRAHTRDVHSEGYPCSWPGCGKGFVRKALLDRHVKIHTGEKPFTCSVCQYGTSHKSNLDRHVRIHFKSPPSPGKFYPPGLYSDPQLHHLPPSHLSPFLGAWAKPESAKEPGHVSTLPDSTTDHVSPSSARVSSPIRHPRHSSLFSPDKFPVPFSPCTLDSITPLKLSPVKNLTNFSALEPWWSPAASTHFTPMKLPGSLGLTPNTSSETSQDISASSKEVSRAASFLSAPGTPGKRSASEGISHGIRSILGEADADTEEELDVDGDISDDNEEFQEEEDYVPKKMRLAKQVPSMEA